ncbi:MAG TPA: hypothetical protein VMR50_12965 [Myxococcota bacterium]|nr:hypothetical protein [Myxococcota bacterium]
MDEATNTAGPHRARRVLAWTPLLFFAAQLAIGWRLDRAPLSVRFGDGVVKLAAASAEPRPGVVFFGSSRFKALVEPAVVERKLRAALGDAAPRVVSLAFNGGDLVGTDFMFAQLVARGVRPKLAVVEVTPEWLRHPIPFLNGQLLRIFEWSDVIDWFPELVLGTRRTLVCARLFPVYCYRNELLTWWTGRSPPYLSSLPDSAAPPRKPKADDPKHGAHRWARTLRDYEVSDRALGVLRRILARCHDERIDCVLVAPPVASAQRAILDGKIDAAYESALERVRGEPQVPFYDESARLPDQAFHDSSHGNKRGGALFSEIMADEVVLPRLAPP